MPPKKSIFEEKIFKDEVNRVKENFMEIKKNENKVVAGPKSEEISQIKNES